MGQLIYISIFALLLVGCVSSKVENAPVKPIELSKEADASSSSQEVTPNKIEESAPPLIRSKSQLMKSNGNKIDTSKVNSAPLIDLANPPKTGTGSAVPKKKKSN